MARYQKLIREAQELIGLSEARSRHRDQKTKARYSALLKKLTRKNIICYGYRGADWWNDGPVWLLCSYYPFGPIDDVLKDHQGSVILCRSLAFARACREVYAAEYGATPFIFQIHMVK